MITASKTELLRHCQWWARDDVRLPPQPQSDAASLGIEVHARIEAHLRGECRPVTGEAAPYVQHAIDWVSEYERRWYGSANKPNPEVAFALHPHSKSARVIEAPNRDYGTHPPGTICGTADAVAVHYDRVEVIDWKTGRVPPSAYDNAQLLTLAVAACLASDCDSAQVYIVHLTPEGASHEAVTLDSIDIESWRLQLCDLLDAIETAEPKTGAHCRNLYCPALGICPATSGALEVVAPKKTRLPIVNFSDQIQGPEHASMQLEFIRYAEQQIRWAKEAVRRWADEHGGVQINGKTWAKHESTRETIDLNPEAVEVLRKQLGDHADEVFALSTNKTAIKSAVKKYAQEYGVTAANLERDTITKLREVGAVKTTTSTKYEEK